MNTCVRNWLQKIEAYLLFQKSKKEVFCASTIGMNEKGALWSPLEQRINQLAHLLSFRLQINPNFKNSVNEFLIHHPSYYLYISFIGQKIFNK